MNSVAGRAALKGRSQILERSGQAKVGDPVAVIILSAAEVAVNASGQKPQQDYMYQQKYLAHLFLLKSF